MALSKNAVRDLYRERAGSYDITANLYYLIGFREAKYRKMAVSQLHLKPGDTVVEIGCGTGLNFPYILEYLGNTGKLIGVDLTGAMLDKAQLKVEKKGWENVHLIQGDAAKYTFPDTTNCIFSSFALTLAPEYQNIIEAASHSLADGGRFVLLDFKKPEKWPLWVTKMGVAITKPFGVTLDLAERKPWEVMKKYFRNVTVTDLYGGFVYIAAGEKSS
ncbi:MAG: class I SAM-dependent methyltransferase [FCB group bacterium]|nr:class I SAM-dependent methyltransferase [FCB group bacterium]